MADEYKAPLPNPTPEAKPFWEGLQAHRLQIQRCKDCGTAYFYPRDVCPGCLSANVEWFTASGRGKLHTFVINQRPARGFPAKGPYVLGIVELDEGPRMMTNIIGVEPDPKKLRCDMAVHVVFEPITEEISLPKFRPVEG